MLGKTSYSQGEEGFQGEKTVSQKHLNCHTYLLMSPRIYSPSSCLLDGKRTTVTSPRPHEGQTHCLQDLALSTA